MGKVDKSDSESESENNSEEETPKKAVKPKRSPGRPPKPIIKIPVPHLGIVSEPSNLHKTIDKRSINVYEIVYDNPTMFKKIFSLFRAMSVENIRLRLEKENIKMFAQDHKGVNLIYVKIHGKDMNRYYTSKIYEFGLGSSTVQKILQTLNKNTSKIYWYSTVQYEKSKIKIGLTDDTIEDDSIFNVDIDQVEEYDWEVEEELRGEEQYPLRFELPSSNFKRKVADFKLLGQIMKIEKNGEGPLLLSYVFTNKKGDQYTSFKNPGRINMISTLDPGEIFSTSVYLENIKPLSNTLISDVIRISACIDKKIIFTAFLDEKLKKKKKKIYGSHKCEIKVLTNIVTVREDVDASPSTSSF